MKSKKKVNNINYSDFTVTGITSVESKTPMKKKKIKHKNINKVSIGKFGNRIVSNRCGRNDLCLCGSGKKYKRCGGV